MKPIIAFAVAIMLISSYSCSTVLPGYTPNAPLLKEKGDLRLGGNLVLGGATTGGNVQVAVAASDHFYLGAGSSFLNHEGMSSNFTDLSLGYFGRKENLAYEFSAGGGLGGFNYGDDMKDRITRFHGQAAAAYVTDRIQFGGGLRVAGNTYKYVGKPINDPGIVGPISYEEELSGVVSIEPFLLMRAGGPKTSFQFMFCYPVLPQDQLSVLPDPTISLGITLMLGKNKKRGTN